MECFIPRMVIIKIPVLKKSICSGIKEIIHIGKKLLKENSIRVS